MKTVLIVEDNALNMKLFGHILESAGYAVIRAEDGLTGLALAKQQHPDLIIMDIQLPDISGLDVTRQIRADDALRDTPVVAVTAFAMKGDDSNILAAGCNGYIAKPIDVPVFLETVARFVD